MTEQMTIIALAQEKSTRRSRVSGIERSVQILDALSERGSATSAYAIAKIINAPISTVYSIVDELIARGILSRSEDNLVWLGPRLFRYGLALQAQSDILVESKREMHRLRYATGETVQICNRDEGMMVVVAMAEGTGQFRVSSQFGSHFPLNWTASGRLLVGHLRMSECRAIFERFSEPSPTGRAETDPDILAHQAHEDLRNRLAVQMGISEFSVACIASPICDTVGACVATISIVMPEQKALENLDHHAEALKGSAKRIEHALGFAKA